MNPYKGAKVYVAADAFKAMREKARLTQGQLAIRINAGRNTIGRWEKTNASVYYQLLKDVAERIFKCDVDLLIASDQPAQKSQSVPSPQQVYWGPVVDRPPGLWIESDGLFVDWPDVKEEVERKLLNQCANWVPGGSIVELRELEGVKNWIMRIVSTDGAEIGNVYFGLHPRREWTWCGLVWVGPVHKGDTGRIWRTFARYSDGTYRILDRAEERRLLKQFESSSS
ncbi:MAG TPA: helix-turn-helix transcriptional regulator [Tepidisphaeraceae bacterium]